MHVLTALTTPARTLLSYVLIAANPQALKFCSGGGAPLRLQAAPPSLQVDLAGYALRGLAAAVSTALSLFLPPKRNRLSSSPLDRHPFSTRAPPAPPPASLLPTPLRGPFSAPWIAVGESPGAPNRLVAPGAPRGP